jgi:hypothetical protein
MGNVNLVKNINYFKKNKKLNKYYCQFIIK